MTDATATPDQRKALVDWFEAEFTRRTVSVHEGTARIDWIALPYRVSFTELAAKAEELGIPIENGVEFRLWWFSLRDWNRWMTKQDKRVAKQHAGA